MSDTPTRHGIRLAMRRPPRLIRAIRHWRNPQGDWAEYDSKPWWFYWFASVVPYSLRAAHRWYADRGGFFWLPCPLCGVHFGGHEWRPVGGRVATVPDPTQPPRGRFGPFASVGICPRCTRDGRGVGVGGDW